MASDNQANYAKIGFAVVLGIVLTLGALVYLGGFRDVRDEFFAETYFENGVSGLSVGSAVELRGIKVGEVRDVNFVNAEYPKCSKRDGQCIWVKMSLNRKHFGLGDGEDADAKVREFVERGLHATISSSAITGLSRIALDFKSDAADRRISWTPRTVAIPPAPSIMEAAANSIDRIIAQLDKVDIADGWTNAVAALVSAQGALAGVDALLQSEQGRISEILENAREATSSLRDWADRLRTSPSQLIWSRDPEPLPETR